MRNLHINKRDQSYANRANLFVFYTKLLYTSGKDRTLTEDKFEFSISAAGATYEKVTADEQGVFLKMKTCFNMFLLRNADCYQSAQALTVVFECTR